MLVPISVKTRAQCWGESRLVAGLSQAQAELCKWNSFLRVHGRNFSRNLEPSQTSLLAVPSTTPTFQPHFLQLKHKVNLPRRKHLILSISREDRRKYKLSVTQDNYIALCTTYHFDCFFPSAKSLTTAGIAGTEASWLFQVTSRYCCILLNPALLIWTYG